MSESLSLRQQPNGMIQCEGGINPYGRISVGLSRTTANKSQMLVLDRTSTNASTPTASHGEVYILDVAGLQEFGSQVQASVPAASAAGVSFDKIALSGSCTTAAVSNLAGGIVYGAIGVQGAAASNAANTEGAALGVQGTASVAATSDATAYGGNFLVNNIGGTAVTTVGTAKSKYALGLLSAGVTGKNTAFCYAVKAGVTPINCAHGILVDSASVDANPFAVVSGTTPTVLWSVTPTGGTSAVIANATAATVTAVTASGVAGVINYSAAATLAAVTTIDAVITNTFVKATSVITLTPGVITVAAGSWIIPTVANVGAGVWTLRLYNPGAATATGAGGVINVYYKVDNTN